MGGDGWGWQGLTDKISVFTRARESSNLSQWEKEKIKYVKGKKV